MALFNMALFNMALFKRLEDLGSSPAEEAEIQPEYLTQLVPQEIGKFRQMLGENRK